MSSMEDLLQTQEQLALAIEQTYSNFKKDGSDRKTSTYIRQRLDTLDSYWSEYQSNHIKLCGFGDKSHHYFTSNRFEVIRDRFSNVRTTIQNYQPREDTSRPSTPLIKPATPMSVPSTSQQAAEPAAASRSQGISSKTDEMLRKQTSHFKAFEHTICNINLATITEKWEFDHLLRVVQARWSAIDSLHWELDSELGGRDPDYEAVYFRFERKYNEVIKSINRKLWCVSHREQSTPHIELPYFSGSYHQWTSFKDLFVETIHNNPTLSSAQRMQFLKSKVKGEAERLIQHLSISSENYTICWDILTHRYDNKKLILNSHFDILFSIPIMPHPSINHLKRIHDTTRETLNAIKNLGITVDSWDPLLIYILCQKLDTETHGEYIASLKQPRDVPIISDFLSFLENKFTTMESSKRKPEHSNKPIMRNPNQSNSSTSKFNKPISKYDNKQSFPPQGRPISQSFYNRNVYTTKLYKCPICKADDHAVYCCNQFLDMKPLQKRQTIYKFNICQNCLYCHYGKTCISEKRCRECNRAHNTLLHESFTQSERTSGAASAIYRPDINTKPETSNAVRSNSHVSLQGETPEVLLATAVIKVQTSDGTYIHLRALLDQGSQTSLITENAAQLLGMPRRKCQGIISGIGAKESSCKGIIRIQCLSINDDFEFDTEALIMNNLIKNLPSHSFSKPSWTFLNNLNLADPEFYHSRPVDLLLGADIYSIILLEGVCKISNDSPLAQNTRLGWILSGNIKTLQCNVILNHLEEIHKFWEIEDISETIPISNENKLCIEYYKNTTVRREDGRYEVRLPLKQDFKENLGASKYKAIAQFKSLERKFNRNKDISKDYKLFMNEYESLGHMKPAISHSTPDCYLTHHCVERAESTSTKLRVVFNASSKTSSGQSLNDVMEAGPNLQQDLQSLIIKWRQYQYGFTADIEKMFRQIIMNENDQNYQKIIWRSSLHEPIKEYQLTTVTYGTKAAPFLAMMTLRQLASDERQNFTSSPAPDVLEQSFYTDDVVYGAHDPESAKQLCRDLKKLLQAGGFNLRKWKSNLPAILPDAVESSILESFNFTGSEHTKTLGLGWNPQKDVFVFESKIDTSNNHETKRSLLSNISKLFDPLGWLSPLSTKLKIIFQNVWLSEIKWDDPLPKEIELEWQKIKYDIKNINQLEIPRWIQTQESDTIELHGFCDSSIKAYACVIYIRIARDQNSSIRLLGGKSRLVPASTKVSLPRLELSAALLLSKLITKVKECLKSYDIKVYGWSDSMIVLGWLSGDPTRWNTFVANRVREITSIMPRERWNYVKSEENPADCASRGLTVTQLKDHSLWWKGPTWLSDYVHSDQIQSFKTEQEIKIKKQVNVVTEEYIQNNIINQLLSNYSSVNKIIRILSWMLRFTKTKQNKPKYLTLQELERAKNVVIKNVQYAEFSKEITCLKEGDKVHSKSKIMELNPLLDQNGLLRVGGRLRKANISPEMKHPLIIPKNSRLAELLIDHAHLQSFHGGARITTSFLRQRYWLIGGYGAIKKRLRNCIKCRHHKPDKHNQLMGDLPASRVNPTRPFYNTGVDLTGFVDVKSSRGRGIKTTKGYVAVFVCMVTKAVHLELVSDLTSSALLAALRRMSARRGTPCHIYSDNGTNFVGASRVLNQNYINLKQTLDEDFFDAITQMEINWHFNAPSWPSAGGLWEAAVKSLKHHLKRVIGEQKLTYEEYSTLLAQLEGCLNSRPLCVLTEDPENINYLTPAHFLSSGPTLTIIETEKDLRTRWQLTQKIFNDIWKRWKSEYLCQLTVRSKWRLPKENFKTGDIVIIQDVNLPAGKWALGRIIELHPGPDGLVRVVTLKTKNGFIKRPITKISRLPVTNTNETTKENKESIESKNIVSAAAVQEKQIRSPWKINLSYYLYLIFSLFVIITPAVRCEHKISSLNSSRGFYFDNRGKMRLEQDQWKLIIYYDMTPFWQGTELLEKYVNHIETACMNSKISQYKIMLLQLHHGLAELEHYNAILLGQQLPGLGRAARARQRRGLINGVGNLANTLFGVLDDRFAQQYAEDIETLRNNQKHLALMWKNQTSVVEAELNLIKRMETAIDKQHKGFNQHLNTLEKQMNLQRSELYDSIKANDLTLSSVIANGVLMNLRNIQETLVDVLTNIYLGRFNFHLLTPDQLRNELNLITGLLTQDLTLPFTNIQSDISKIYHLLTVKAKAMKDFIIFEVGIPLVRRDSFDIYKLIPIPQEVNKKMITLIPISDYVAVNIQKDSYVTMIENNLQNCINYDTETYICPLNQPVYQMSSDQNLCVKNPISDECETTSLTCKHEWIELRNINTYLYFCCGQCPIRIICEHHVTAVQLEMAGIITLSNECIIKGRSFSIFPHKKLSNTMEQKPDIIKIDIPPINNLINLSIPTSAIDTQYVAEDHQKDIENISKQINDLKAAAKEEVTSDRVSNHDLHHYVAIYIIGGAGVAALVFVVARRLRRRAGRPAPSGAGATPPAPQLQVGYHAEPSPAMVQCISESDVNLCSASVNKSNQSEKSVKSSVRVLNKASSPILKRQFSL